MNDNLKKIQTKFNFIIQNWDNTNPQRIYFNIENKSLNNVIDYIFNGLDLRFITVSAVDTIEGIEMLYHFSDDKNGIILSLCVIIRDKKIPQINSITSIITGASWIEREIHELLGVDFIGNNKLKHLLLAEDWPQGSYPLRQNNER